MNHNIKTTILNIHHTSKMYLYTIHIFNGNSHYLNFKLIYVDNIKYINTIAIKAINSQKLYQDLGKILNMDINDNNKDLIEKKINSIRNIYVKYRRVSEKYMNIYDRRIYLVNSVNYFHLFEIIFIENLKYKYSQILKSIDIINHNNIFVACLNKIRRKHGYDIFENTKIYDLYDRKNPIYIDIWYIPNEQRSDVLEFLHNLEVDLLEPICEDLFTKDIFKLEFVNFYEYI